jgi:hypothetical protein
MIYEGFDGGGAAGFVTGDTDPGLPAVLGAGACTVLASAVSGWASREVCWVLRSSGSGWRSVTPCAGRATS